MSFRTALERLLAFEPKRLIRGRYWDGTCGCWLGAVCPDMRFERTYFGDSFGDCVTEAGLTVGEAQRGLDESDLFRGTNEARYSHMVEWTARRVTEEEQADG